MAFARLVRVLLLSALVLADARPSRAATAPEESPSSESADVTVSLPAGKPSEVSVSLAEGSVLLDLPAGSIYPADISEATGGLLRGAEATPGSSDRIRVELRLAGGLFSGATYGPRSVTLRFRRRMSFPSSLGNPVGQYVLGKDDRLRIAVNGKEESTGESVIGQTGTVSAPFVGEITAEGLTVDEFTQHLIELLARDYLVSPKVDVQVLDYRSQWVMVTGEVKKAGRVFLRGASTVKEVLAEAEGTTGEAGEIITISRQKAKPGEPSTLTIDRGAFERGESNPAVRAGDIVTVGPAAFCFVNGEVKNPGDVKVTRGMTLLRAISMAGGLTEWANRKEVQLSEKGSSGPVRVYNLKRIEENPELDPPLKGGELIVVKRRFL
jgi:polysaccharide export outer membrane protein